MRIIYDCFIGPPIFGIITAEDVLVRRILFKEVNANVLGFRKYFPKIEVEGIWFYEVGEFMDRLYRGDTEAHIMLAMNKDFEESRTWEMTMLKDNKKIFYSLDIPRTLINITQKRLSLLREDKSYFSDKKSLKKLGYNKEVAYLCNLYMRLANNFLNTGEFKTEIKDVDLLTTIKEGYFSEATIEKEIKAQLSEVESKLKSSTLPQRANMEKIHNTLLNIREHDKRRN